MRMTYLIRELRDATGMTQREFANAYRIPLSTLRKWEQGEASPAPYVIELLARTIPSIEQSLMQISGSDGAIYYYDKSRRMVLDGWGNFIKVQEDLEEVKIQSLRDSMRYRQSLIVIAVLIKRKILSGHDRRQGA